jgi:hypothetical protein
MAALDTVVGNLRKYSQGERGWKIWQAYLSACNFLTAAIIFMPGESTKNKRKNKGIFSEMRWLRPRKRRIAPGMWLMPMTNGAPR